MIKTHEMLIVLIIYALHAPAFSQAKTSHQEQMNHGLHYGVFENHRSLEVPDEKPVIKDRATTNTNGAQSKACSGRHHKLIRKQLKRHGHAANRAEKPRVRQAQTGISAITQGISPPVTGRRLEMPQE